MSLTESMVNENYDPSANEDDVLEVLQEGRANPLYIREQTGLEKGDVEYALRNLRNAGWIQQLTEGLYEFVEDPRRD